MYPAHHVGQRQRCNDAFHGSCPSDANLKGIRSTVQRSRRPSGVLRGVYYGGQNCTLDPRGRGLPEFYSALFDEEIVRDYGRAMLVTAPSQRPSSMALFRQSWSDLENTIKGLIIRDEVSCTICRREECAMPVREFFQFEVYSRPADPQVKSEDIWHECERCRSPYCRACFAELEEKDLCRRCSTFMLKRSYAASLPLITPRRLDLVSTSLTRVDAWATDDDRVRKVVATVTFSAKHRIPQQADTGSTQAMSLGERGDLTCEFHNLAVRATSGDWYIVAAEPGVCHRGP